MEVKVLDGALKCRACGVHPVLKRYNQGRYKHYCVECAICGMRTRPTTNADKAVSKWNEVMR